MLCMNDLYEEEVFFKKLLNFCIGEGVQANGEPGREAESPVHSSPIWMDGYPSSTGVNLAL